VAENNSFMEFEICLLIPWRQLCIIFSELSSMSFLSVYRIELYKINEQWINLPEMRVPACIMHYFSGMFLVFAVT
jgi:hypothetical protein